jgi:HAD superfamily 5'-nucleotidase-like hydrolase
MIFVNRILNLNKIQAIGFDMDHTLVRYHVAAFERHTFHTVINKLIDNLGYPEEIKNLKFDEHRIIRGLVIDCQKGNILKLNLFNRVKKAHHGLSNLDHNTVREVYKGEVIDLSDSRYMVVDTSFSLAFGHLFALLVDLLNKGRLPQHLTYETLAHDCNSMIDISHQDGSLKDEVKANLEKYIIKDPQIVEALESLKAQGKRLLVITNSAYPYSNLLMSHAFDPYLKDHKSWHELFEIIVTQSMKPKFFTSSSPLLKVDPTNGKLENYSGPFTAGIFQGGSASKLQRDLNIDPDSLLYIGDHIYGDILSLKKSCQWRTAVVVEELKTERKGLMEARECQLKIDELMDQKMSWERDIDGYYHRPPKINQQRKEEIKQKIIPLDEKLSKLIIEFNTHFNPHWGELLRAGPDPSLLAWQIERYACIYMENVANLGEYSGKTYFRPMRRELPHELPYT